jgi:hypothetical protein
MPVGVTELDLAASEAYEAGRQAEALGYLIAANHLAPDPEREIRIRDLRFTDELYSGRASPKFDDAPIILSYNQGMPTCSLADVTPAVVRAAFKDRGCLYIPGAIDAQETSRMREAVDNAQNSRLDDVPDPRWHHRPRMATSEDSFTMVSVRGWANAVGGALGVDSPRAMFLTLDMLQRNGLIALAEAYLGEAPVLSASKFMLWRIPGEGPEAGWHQDGRFLGDDIFSLNVWTALSDCGEDAPGMDLVLERLDHYVMPPTDSVFGWVVSDLQVDAYRERDRVVSPQFKGGDMLLFDNWLLHRTNRRPGMSITRYAIESWLFAPSAFPKGRIAVTV